jgi:hypothetical protein
VPSYCHIFWRVGLGIQLELFSRLGVPKLWAHLRNSPLPRPGLQVHLGGSDIDQTSWASLGPGYKSPDEFASPGPGIYNFRTQAANPEVGINNSVRKCIVFVKVSIILQIHVANYCFCCLELRIDLLIVATGGWTLQLHLNFIGDRIWSASTISGVVEAGAHVSGDLDQPWIAAPEAASSVAFSETQEKHLAACQQNGRCCFKVRARPRFTHSLHVQLADTSVQK